jgi:hypothetical protein
MSEHDFSGIEERRGRWWWPMGATLFVFGCLIALVLIAVAAGHAVGD